MQVSMVEGGPPGGGPNVFGSRIAQIPTPNPYDDLSKAYPNLSGTNAATSGALLSELNGQLSPQTISQIHDAAATFGVGSGMPGSGLMAAKYAKDIGLRSEDLQNQGLHNYSSIIPAVSSTQTVNPSLQAEISGTNAVNAAAPDPTAAASYAQSLFDKYLTKLSGPAGGTGSGGGAGALPWYAQGHAGQTWVTPGAAGGGRGDTTIGGAGGYWG